jgi:hypothetical protein
MKTKIDTSARKNLIAEIAQRHAAEQRLIKQFSVNESKTTSSENDYDSIVEQELEKLLTSSTFNPISL